MEVWSMEYASKYGVNVFTGVLISELLTST